MNDIVTRLLEGAVWVEANARYHFNERQKHDPLRQSLDAAEAMREAATALALSTPPKPSLVGDALAAAGQSIGMSVTRVHPEPEKVGEAENPMRFFCSNVDSWGAAEWFDRLAQAIRARDKAIVAGNDISAETHRMIASSSAMRLVRDFEPIVRAALTPPVADARRVEEWQDISTAPMDGTPILITRPTRFPAEEMYHVVRWERDGGWTEGFWAVHDGKNDYPLRGAEPTLWMPLQVEAPLYALKGDSHGQ